MELIPANFNLNNEIKIWQQHMLSGALSPDDVEELTDHLHGEIAQLQSNGLSEEEAWLVARHRIGRPVIIDNEFNKVNPDFAANRNLLMLFWGGVIFMLLQTLVYNFPDFLHIFPGVGRNPATKMFTTDQIKVILYMLTGAFACFITFVVVKNNKVALWFNELVMRHSSLLIILLLSLGLFSAYFNYRTTSSHIARIYYTYNEIGGLLNILGATFYGGLIFCTAWFTMRYSKKEFRTPKTFHININWFNAFVIGAIIENIVTAIGGNTQSNLLMYTLIAILYPIAGYIISKSQKAALNLFSLQFYACIYWVSLGYFNKKISFYECLIPYLVILFFLLVGFVIGKLREFRLQTS